MVLARSLSIVPHPHGKRQTRSGHGTGLGWMKMVMSPGPNDGYDATPRPPSFVRDTQDTRHMHHLRAVFGIENTADRDYCPIAA